MRGLRVFYLFFIVVTINLPFLAIFQCLLSIFTYVNTTIYFHNFFIFPNGNSVCIKQLLISSPPELGFELMKPKVKAQRLKDQGLLL